MRLVRRSVCTWPRSADCSAWVHEWGRGGKFDALLVGDCLHRHARGWWHVEGEVGDLGDEQGLRSSHRRFRNPLLCIGAN
jgi:hypothetical protein